MTVEFSRGFPTPTSAEAAHQDQDLRRALEAYHFFYPTVSMEAIVPGTRARARPTTRRRCMVLAQPRHVGFTLNSDTPYAGGILDLRERPDGGRGAAGPAGRPGRRPSPALGRRPGLAGPDAGKGGRHLILPPGWDGPVPDGYLTARSDTWLVLLALRALPLGGDLDAAIRLLTSVRIYPLASRTATATGTATWTRTARPADTTPLAWEDNLGLLAGAARGDHAEPPVEEMRPMLGTLAELGIEAGRPFAAGQADQARVLTGAAAQGRDEMLVAAFASRRPDRMVWPDRAWEWVGLRPENGAFERDGLARRRGAGPLVRAGHRGVPGHVPPRGRPGFAVLAGLPGRARRVSRRRPQLQADRPAAGAREPVLVRHLL